MPKPVIIAKKITTFVVGLGAGKIVSAIVENNTDPESATDKVAIKLGSYALGGLVADAASKYTDAKIDEVIDAVEKIKASLKKTSQTEK